MAGGPRRPGAGAVRATPSTLCGKSSSCGPYLRRGRRRVRARRDGSPQFQLVQGTLDKACVGLPARADAGSLVGVLMPVAAQGVGVLALPQNQQCAENSTRAKGDEALSHLLDDIPVLSGNGVGNS
ncbi:rodlin [Streptomyces sp. NPDC097727]|uniref:rodlin n=1 Tax=Streptomyces sp. NPDC097727 TaxID=3366092 RepID=UPI003828A178